MTVSTAPYYHWSSRSDSLVAPYNACSPNLTALMDYYRRRWGAVSLGCHNDRPVRGGTSLSTHAWGAALDPQFPNRAITVEAMAWTISVSAELGINTIHDYVTQQMWKPGGVGWVSASIGSIGGQWIHVETTPAMFLDGRPVEDKLTGSEADVPLTGDDAKLVAAVVWETMITYNGVTKTAREWLGLAADANLVWGHALTRPDGTPQPAGSVAIDTLFTAAGAKDNAVAANTKLDGLTVPGGDVEAVRQIVREELDATQWQSRPPS